MASRLKTLQSFAGTSILYMNGMSNPAMHNNENLPVFLLGDAGGKLRTGRHLRLSGRRYVNDLHATLLSAYGLPTTSFGDPKYVRGPLDGIKQAGAL